MLFLRLKFFNHPLLDLKQLEIKAELANRVTGRVFEVQSCVRSGHTAREP
jgi:hypothetical protein